MDEVLRKALVLEDPENFLKKTGRDRRSGSPSRRPPTDVVTH